MGAGALRAPRPRKRAGAVAGAQTAMHTCCIGCCACPLQASCRALLFIKAQSPSAGAVPAESLCNSCMWLMEHAVGAGPRRAGATQC